MNEKLEEIEKKLLFFKEKLSLMDIGIRIKISNKTGVYFDENLDCFIIHYKDQGIDYALAHELGHILLSKKTNCPTFANPPLFDDVDETIFTILDYLVNVIVNSLVCRSNDLYDYYSSFFAYYINLDFRFRNATELLVFNISTKLEYLFNLKLQDKNISYMIRMAQYNERLKNYSGFSQEKYDGILLKLNKYKDVIKTFDLQKIKDFLFEITCLICEIFDYMDLDNIRNQFEIFFE